MEVKKMKTKQDEEKKEEEVKEDEEVVEPTEEKEEVKEEEKPEEEKTEEASEEDVAEKIMELVNKKAAEATKKVEAKKKVYPTPGLKVNDYDLKFYESRNGDNIMIKKSEVDALSGWFKNYVGFAKTKNPDAFASMKKEYNKLEDMAYAQKLEPLQTGVAAEGGNLVPTILYNKLVPILEDIAIVRKHATIIDMKGIKTLDLPGIASKPYVSWNSETAQKATTSAEFNKISLTPYILAGIVVITQQLIDDAPFQMLKIISQMLAEAIAREEDNAFMTGSGAGQPTGITTYGAGTTVAAGGNLAYNHFNAVYFNMPVGHRTSKSLKWVMHRTTLATVANMIDGNNRPILDLSGALTAPGIPTIRGAEVLEQNDVSNNIIYLVDFKYYWIGYSRTMSIDTSDQATIGGDYDADRAGGTLVALGQNMWERNELAIRAEEKVDGELVTTRALGTITAVRS